MRLSPALLLPAVLGCNPALRGGLYLITVTDVRNDSCELWEGAWDYEDDGNIWWDDRQTMVVETTSGQWIWDYDGDTLTNQDVTTETWDPDCQAVFSEDNVGTIVTSNNWVFTQSISLDLEGACLSWNTGMMPCTVDIDNESERIGD